jgi:hypothetical protein
MYLAFLSVSGFKRCERAHMDNTEKGGKGKRKRVADSSESDSSYECSLECSLECGLV